MGVTAALSTSELTVDPGREGTVQVRVRNTGIRVDEIALAVLGEPAQWSVVEPSSISLLPNTEGTATVRLRPPRSSEVAAGRVAFAVQASSQEDPDGSAVEEGVVDVGRFDEQTAELLPRTARGRFRARYELSVDNRGNAPLSAAVSPLEPDGALRFRFVPPVLEMPPGTAAFARVVVAPSKIEWKGSPKTKAFKVRAADETPGRPVSVADASFLQEPVIPKWLPRALIAAVALVGLLVALWYGLLRPTIKNTATAAVAPAVSSANSNAATASSAAKSASQNANVAQSAASKVPGSGVAPPSNAAGGTGGSGTGGTSTATTTTTAPGPDTTSAGGRLSQTVASGKTASSTLSGLPAKRDYELTDLIFENPNGDSGTAEIMSGKTVVFQVSLADFRDLDYHFVSPVTFGPGTPPAFTISCADPTGQTCSDAVYISGFVG